MEHSQCQGKIIIFVLSFLAFLLVANFCYAANSNLGDAFEKNGPLDQVAGNNGAGYNTTQSPENIISLIITTVLSFLGVIFLVLAIYAGYTWMTAGGNEELVKKAKDTLTSAIIGLVIVLASYVISWYIINILGNAVFK